MSPFFKGGFVLLAVNPSLKKRGRGDFRTIDAGVIQRTSGTGHQKAMELDLARGSRGRGQSDLKEHQEKAEAKPTDSWVESRGEAMIYHRRRIVSSGSAVVSNGNRKSEAGNQSSEVRRLRENFAIRNLKDGPCQLI